LKGILSLFIFLCFFDFDFVSCDTQPQQIHLSLTGDPTEMFVMWTTVDQISSTVQYSTRNNGKFDFSLNGTWDYYYLPYPPFQSPYIHSAKLENLTLNTRYYYQVGSLDGGWSNTSFFDTFNPNAPVIVASIGDHGTSDDSQHILNDLVTLMQQSKVNFLTHSGDISYANGVSKYWDIWANMVQPFAAYVPWMVGVGNHELLELFVPYEYRFRMPANESNSPGENRYYSFNYGKVHLIALSSEEAEYWHFSYQYDWLSQDLQNVNRKVTPWIVSIWHSPWYCSNTAHYGSGDDMKASYEDIFHQYNVDLVINGHVHAYERTYPVYQGNKTPGATVYVTNGIGGTEEGLAGDWYDQPEWSAYREATFWGYGVFTVYNNTHLQWQMMNIDTAAVQDQFWLIKQNNV